MKYLHYTLAFILALISFLIWLVIEGVEYVGEIVKRMAEDRK